VFDGHDRCHRLRYRLDAQLTRLLAWFYLPAGKRWDGDGVAMPGSDRFVSTSAEELVPVVVAA
jgi:hypothetical protein